MYYIYVENNLRRHTSGQDG